MGQPQINWGAIAADPRFLALRRKKRRLLWGAMLFSVTCYLLLPIGAAYLRPLFALQVWGVLNVGLLLAFAEFLVAWGIAILYVRRANREFDLLAQELIQQAHRFQELPP